MLTYLCKYTPLELLRSLGMDTYEPNTDAEDFRSSDAWMHSSVCTHAKMLLEDISSADAGQSLILTNCCDSIRRVYDTVADRPFAYKTMLDLPHVVNRYTVELYAAELKRLVSELTSADANITNTSGPENSTDTDMPNASGPENSKGSARASICMAPPCLSCFGRGFDRPFFVREWTEHSRVFRELTDHGPFLAIFGARVSDQLRTRIRDAMPLPVIDLTCGGLRTMPEPPANALKKDSSGHYVLSDDDLMNAYARALLTQLPCTRMEDVASRSAVSRLPGLRGIIYHSIRFCDYYSFEYADIRDGTNLPILKIESDYTAQSEGQLDTRIRAFAESLSTHSFFENEIDEAVIQGRATDAETAKTVIRGHTTDSEISKASRSEPAVAPGKGSNEKTASARFKRLFRKTKTADMKGDSLMNKAMESSMNKARGSSPNATGDPRQNIMRDPDAVYIGIDSGSTSTNVAAIDGSGRLLASAILRTGAKAGSAAERAYREVQHTLGPRAKHIRKIVATGYGREFITFADETKTEISCHARGAHFMSPKSRTVIDIGGQDSKVICMDEGGNVTNFVMNDKCAAGTGRFLEMMAHTLEIDMDEMSRAGLRWKRDLTISSTCTVFAESEVVGLIAENADTGDIVHALDVSVASKTCGMVKRVRGTAPYMMTGGVAKNAGVAKEIERRLGERLTITDYPDLTGAIGAALFARE